MPEQEIKKENVPAKEEKKSDWKFLKYVWTAIAALLVLTILAALISRNVVKLSTFVWLTIIAIFFFGSLFFIVWLLFLRKAKKLPLKELTKDEARMAVYLKMKKPPEQGGYLKELDLLKAELDTVKTLGREKKTSVYHLRTVDHNKPQVWDCIIRMDNPDKWGAIKKRTGELMSDYDLRIDALLASLAEHSGDVQRIAYYDPQTGVQTRTVEQPAPSIEHKEEKELAA